MNVLLDAHRRKRPRFEEHPARLQVAFVGEEPFGVSEIVTASFVRISTHHRIYLEPTPPPVAPPGNDRRPAAIDIAPSSVIHESSGTSAKLTAVPPLP